MFSCGEAVVRPLPVSRFLIPFSAYAMRLSDATDFQPTAVLLNSTRGLLAFLQSDLMKQDSRGAHDNKY